MNDLSFYLKQLKKEEQIKSKVSRRREIKIRMKIDNNRQKSMKLKPAGLIRKECNSPVTSIRNEKNDITRDSRGIKKIRAYRQQFYADKCDKLDEMKNYLKDKLPKLPQEERQDLNSPGSIKEIELAVENFPTKTTPCPQGSTDKFYQVFTNSS